jgi:hypothetical protein
MYIDWSIVSEKIDPMIFFLTNTTKNSVGTAFLINKSNDGWLYFLTARHNVQPQSSIINLINHKGVFSNVGVLIEKSITADLSCLMCYDVNNIFSKNSIPRIIDPTIVLSKGKEVGFSGFAFGNNSLASASVAGNVFNDCSANGPWFRHGYISTKSNISRRYVVNGDSTAGMSGCPAFTQLDDGEIVYIGALSEAQAGVIVVDELPWSTLVQAALIV